jgi:hypothetical protein
MPRIGETILIQVRKGMAASLGAALQGGAWWATVVVLSWSEGQLIELIKQIE